MCKALDEYWDKAKQEGHIAGHREGHIAGHREGEARGIIEILEEMKVPREQIIDKLIKKLQITMDEALDYLAIGDME